MWEYFHFMTDFAPMFYPNVQHRNNLSECQVVYGNGIHAELFHLQNPPKDYHMPEKWGFLFGKPFNLEYKWVGGALPAECQEVSWKNWGVWASGPAERFTAFRAHALIQAGVDSSTPPAGVVLIRRGKQGALRRSIDDTFYTAASTALDLEGVKYRTVDLEPMTMQEQIRLFATTRVVVGQHGAGLSNINWMKDGTTVVELGHRIFKCYENLALAVNLRYVAFEPEVWTNQLQGAIRKGATQLATMIKTQIDATDDRYLQLSGQKKLKCPSMATVCDFDSAT